MSGPRDDSDAVQKLEARIDYLEDVNRFTLEALEQALTLLDFQPGVNRLLRPPDIVGETRDRLQRLMNFEAVAFLLVDEQTSRFEFVEVAPKSFERLLRDETDRLIDAGTFAWAVRESHAVTVPSEDGAKSVLLHSIAGSNRVRGMFIGLLGPGDQYDVSLSLLSILLLGCANALQAVELYDTLNDINRRLAANMKRSAQAREELEKAYERLRRAEETYRSIFENALEGIFKCTPEGKLLEANPTLAEILGFPSADDLMRAGENFFGLLFAHPDQARDFQDRIRAEGTVRNLSAEALRMDGKRVWLSMNCRAVSGPDAPESHFEGMVKDTTLQRLAEAKAEERRRQLIQADKLAALGTLVSGVAHEINNPNGVVMLNAPILKNAWESARKILDAVREREGDFDLGGLPYSRMREEIAPLFEEISEAAGRIKRIVGDLKDFSRLDGREQTDLVDVNAVAKTAVRLVHHKIKRATRNFQAGYDPDIPPVRGHFQKLEQVVINLLLNACQALEGQEQALRISTSADTEKGLVLVTVEDQGTGMDKETLAHIMDPFFTTRRETGGTGLGLSVSAGIVQEHGGELAFTSSPGKGTTAVLRLPAATEEQLPWPLFRRSVQGDSCPLNAKSVGCKNRYHCPAFGGKRTMSALTDKHILIADDEPGLRRSLHLILSQEGCQVSQAEDGLRALDAILEFHDTGTPVDLLVTDIQMPGLNGLELIDELGKAGLDIPTLVITGYGDKQTVVELLRKGCKEFIDKPFGPEELVARVTDVLGKLDAARRETEEAQALLEAEKSRLTLEIETYRRRFDEISEQIDAATAAYNSLLGVSQDCLVDAVLKSRPLSRLGGDYAGVCDSPEGCDVLVADVAGHDAGASYHTILIKAFFEENCRTRASGPDFFRMLNAQLLESGQADRMVTGLFLRLDFTAMTGEVVTAAHPPLLQLGGDGGSPVLLGSDGGPLGVFEDARFRSETFGFAPGDRFFLHTDGVTDASFLDIDSGVRVKLGGEGLYDLIQAYRDLPLAEQTERIWADVLKFCSQKPQDDMLLLALEAPTS